MSQLDLLEAPRVNSMPTPRPFQEATHRELRAGFVGGHQRQLVMSPTGSGKTFLALRLINEALLRSKRAMFICDRKTLIKQTSKTANRYGMPAHGIIQADNPLWAPHRSFQIASAQTLAVRDFKRDWDVIVVDEAHTLMKAVTDLVMATEAAVIGLSATPFTKGLGGIYSRLINAATMHELVEQEILVPLKIFSCFRPDMTGAKTNSKGEWSPEAAAERGMAIIGDIVSEWLERGENRKTICFGSTIDHCEEIRRQFEAAGVNAMLYTGETKDHERDDILKEYEKPNSKIRVLVSVEALAKGFDVPDVGCVCDARPLRKSLSIFIQMIGRGLRSSKETGKTDCILLDFSGNVIRFADDFSDIYFNGLADLDNGEKLDKEVRQDKETKTAKGCPKCGAKPMGKRCIACGFEPVRASLVEHEHGKSQAIDPLGTGTEPSFVSKGYAKNHLELWSMLVGYEKTRAAKKEKAAIYGAPAHRYKELTGRWPQKDWGFESLPYVEPTRPLESKLRSMRIAWAKSQR